uniref:Girdin n=1 Tax=Syphacia muris TaxID=451379 RepID=A0A0N5AEW1_9BILA
MENEADDIGDNIVKSSEVKASTSMGTEELRFSDMDTAEENEFLGEKTKSTTAEEGCSHYESDQRDRNSNEGNVEDIDLTLRQQNVLIAQEKENLENKITQLRELVDVQQKELDLLQKEKVQQLGVLRETEAERDKYKIAKTESEGKSELLVRQKGEFEVRIKNLTCEKDQLSAEVGVLKSELKELVEKNAVLEAGMDEIQKNKRLYKLEKGHWERDRELYLHNKKWLLKEIRDRDSKLSILKLESIKSDGELQAQRASLSEYCESLKNELVGIKKQFIEKDTEIATLNQRLNKAKQEAADKYNELKCELLNCQKLNKELKEINKQAHCQFEKLQLELTNRDKVLDEAKKVSLTDQEVSDLSPAAAAASALIKNGTSLTEVYREHCHAIAKLEALELEKKRLEEYVNQFIDAFEEKAPLLMEQKIEYDRLNKSISALREQLQSADEERQRLVAACDSSSKELAYTKAELEKAQRDNDDLVKQVRHLLYTIESKHITVEEVHTPVSSSDMLWSTIDELQQVNQKLMSDLRSVKANHEQIIHETNQAEINRLNETISDAHRKMNLLKEQNDKQELIIKQLQEQRDTYKRLNDEKTAKEKMTATSALSDTKIRVDELESKIGYYKNCLKTYREEKILSDQVLHDRIDQQSKLITQLRMTNASLEANVNAQKPSEESMTQKSYETVEIELTKKRCERAEFVKESLEKRLCDSETHLLSSKAEVGQLKCQLTYLEEQIKFLRLSESQLRKEIAAARESNYSNEKMAVTFHQLQNRCGKVDEIKQKKLEEQVKVIRNENETLKNYINEITEKHRIVVLDLKMAHDKVEVERNEALTNKLLAEEQLKGKIKECEKLQERYNDLVKQPELLDIYSGDSISASRMNFQDLLSSNVCLKNELEKLRNVLEVTELKLVSKDEEIEELKKLNANSQPAVTNQSVNDFTTKCLNSTVQVLSKQLDDSANKVTELRMQNLKLEQDLNKQLTRAEDICIKGRKKIVDFEKKLIVAECARKVAELDADIFLKRSKEMELKIKESKNEKEKLSAEIKAVEVKLQENLQLLKAAEATKVEDEKKIQDLRRKYQDEIAQLRLEHEKSEELLKESRQVNALQDQSFERFLPIFNKLGVGADQLLDYKKILEQQESIEEITLEESEISPLKLIIKTLSDENKEWITRLMDAEVQKKHFEEQASLLEKDRSKLEEELKKLQLNAEAGSRALSENKIMAARLSNLDNIKHENDIVKKRLEEVVVQKENLSKKISELESRVQTLQAEKIKDEHRVESVVADLQNYRKEAESWKERHSEAIAALNKIGPEKVVLLTGELESTKRCLTSVSTELENSKSCIEDINSKHKSETENLNTTIQQLRILAKNYKAKYLALNSERETLHKELSDSKLRIETSTVHSENDGQTNLAELNSLRQQLLAARHETEKLKQKLASSMPRPTRPVDAMTGASPSTKGPSVLQAQMKQIESLSCLNKDLKGQLESLAVLLKASQDDLNASKAKIGELEKEKEVAITEKESKEEELRFRLNSITSLMTKKDSEMSRLKAESEELKKELEGSNEKICALESALKESRNMKAGGDLNLPSTSKTGCVSESMSSSNVPAPFPTENVKSAILYDCGEVPRIPSITTVSEYNEKTSEPRSLPQLKETKLHVEESAVSYEKTAPTALQEINDDKSGASIALKQLSSSTSNQTSVVSNAPVVSLAVSVSGPNLVEAESFSRSENQVKELCSRSQTSEKNFNSDNSVANRACQSSTVSQSSSNTLPIGCTAFTQHSEAADKNVCSGDEVNVISSSGANNSGMSTAFSDLMSAETTSSFTRKRPVSSANDQSSSVESGSELQETVKRQKITPSEQVSTSSRILHQNVELKLQKESTAVFEEDSADPEQQENVETTTTPEDELVDEGYCLQKERSVIMRRHDAENFGNQKDEEDEGEFETARKQKDGDEEDPVEVERNRADEYLDEALVAGDEEYKDVDDDDYDDEGDDEGVEEEIPNVSNHRSLLPSPRLLAHHQQVDSGEGKAHSQSPADQSTDEADEGPRTSTYRADTSIKQNRAGKDDDTANEGEINSHLQQAKGNTDVDRSIPECKDLRSDCSKASSVTSGSMELTRADTTAHSVNAEFDSRSSSTTVTGNASIGDIRASAIGGSVLDYEGDNDVAEEEHCTKLDFRNRAGQTDDETGMSEPSTSAESRQRRTRILYPDINEPSSSSIDRSWRNARTGRGRGRWPYKLRRNQFRRRP